MAEETCIFYITTKGFLKKLPVEKVKDFEVKFIENLRHKEKDLLNLLTKTKALNDDIEKRLQDVADEFLVGFLQK